MLSIPESMSRDTTAISSAMARNMNTTTLIGMSRREPHQAEEVVTSKEPKKPVGERKGKGRKPKPGKSSGKEPKRAKKTKKSRVGKSMERHGDAHQHDRRCTTKCTPKPKPKPVSFPEPLWL